jgi:peptide/nickel transport system permease protein
VLTRLIVRRVLTAIPLLLITSFVIFLFIHITPGSPEQILLGGKNVSQDQLEAIREQYSLDDPFIVQYFTWLGNFLTGDLGDSISSQVPVGELIGPRIVPTLQLAAYAGTIILVFGIGFGILAALRRNQLLDYVISGLAILGSSIAAYVSAMVLIVVFASTLGWFPTFSLGDGGLDRLYHLTLPAIALAIALIALVLRVTRSAMVEALDQEYVETARSRGFTERRVVLRHALRSALIPVLSISGLVAGYLISGAVLVEYTFGLNGLGSLLIQAIESKDFAVVQTVALIFTFAFILINLVVDVLYMIADPRIRLAAEAAERG